MIIAFFLPATLPHVQLIIISLPVKHVVTHKFFFTQASGAISGLKTSDSHPSDTSGPPLNQATASINSFTFPK